MSQFAEAVEVGSSFALPVNIPHEIKLGPYLGTRLHDNSGNNPGKLEYHFRFANGHSIGLTLHPEQKRADIAFLTSSSAGQSGRSFGVVSEILRQTSQIKDPPALEPWNPELLSAAMLPARAPVSPAESLALFAASTHKVAEAANAQALQYARIIFGRLPEHLREFVADFVFSPDGLAERLKVYGVNSQNGDKWIFTSKVDHQTCGFRSRAGAKRTLEEIKTAWHGVFFDVEIKDPQGSSLELNVRPLSTKP